MRETTVDLRHTERDERNSDRDEREYWGLHYRCVDAMRIAQERADTEHPYDWTSGESFRRYVAQLRSFEACPAGPRRILARITAGEDEHVFSTIVGETLDAAGQDLPGSALIEVADDGRSGVLSW
jgi:hypothetical protein